MDAIDCTTKVACEMQGFPVQAVTPLEGNMVFKPIPKTQQEIKQGKADTPLYYVKGSCMQSGHTAESQVAQTQRPNFFIPAWTEII